MVSEVENAWQRLGTMTCSICSFKASDIGIFQAHICRRKKAKIVIRFEKQREVYICDTCTVELKEFDFIEHLQCHLLEKPFQCSFCFQDFEMRIELYKHFRENHPQMLANYSLKLDKSTKFYLETTKIKGYICVPVLRSENVTKLVGLKSLESLFPPVILPTDSSKEIQDDLQYSASDKECESDEASCVLMSAEAETEMNNETNKVDLDIGKSDCDLDLKQGTEVLSKTYEYSYLNLIIQDDEIVYACSKCKVKFRDKFLFYQHIWKTHVHSSQDFTCCSSSFTLNCPTLQKVIKILNDKSMGLFEVHLHRNEESTFVKKDVSEAGTDTISLISPSDHSLSESPLSKIPVDVVDETHCIQQLKLKVETYENEDEVSIPVHSIIGPKECDILSPAIPESECVSNKSNFETAIQKVRDQVNSNISGTASSESQTFDNVTTDARKPNRKHPETETPALLTHGDSEGTLSGNPKSQTLDNLDFEKQVTENELAKVNSEFELSIRTRGDNTTDNPGVKNITCQTNLNKFIKTTSVSTNNEKGIEHTVNVVNSGNSETSDSSTTSNNANATSEANEKDHQSPTTCHLNLQEDQEGTGTLASTYHKCHDAEPLVSTLAQLSESETNIMNRENEKPKKTAHINKGGKKTRALSSLISDYLVARNHTGAIKSDGADIRAVGSMRLSTFTDCSQKEQRCSNVDKPSMIGDSSGPDAYESSFYKCAFNNCYFSCHSSLDFHTHCQNYHELETMFSCSYCGFESQNIKDLLNHMDHHLNSPCQCYSVAVTNDSSVVESFDNKSLNTLLGQIESMNKTMQDVGYRCNLCLLQFLSIESLKNHLESSTLRTYSCKYCKSHFLDRKSSEIHSRKQHPDLPRYRRQFVHLLCKDRAENHGSFMKLNRAKNYAGNVTSKQSSEQRNSDNRSSNCTEPLEKLLIINAFQKQPEVETTVVATSIDKDAPPANCDPVCVQSASCEMVVDGKEANSSSHHMQSNTTSQKILSSGATGALHLSTKEESLIVENTSAADVSDSEKNVDARNEPMKPEHIKPTESGNSDIATNTCDSSSKDLTRLSFMQHNSQSMERPLPNDSSNLKSRIFDICAKPKTAKYLKNLFKEIGKDSYSCNECEERFPKLRSMLCHIFFCQGKISVVNCPYNCSFESDHPKFVTQHIQQNHSEKNPDCKSFRKINAQIFFQSLKSQEVTQLSFKQACLPFADNDLIDSTLDNNQNFSNKDANCFDSIKIQSSVVHNSDGRMLHGSPEPVRQEGPKAAQQCLKSKSLECEVDSRQVESQNVQNSNSKFSQDMNVKDSTPSKLPENEHCPSEIRQQQLRNGNKAITSPVTGNDQTEKETVKPSVDTESTHCNVLKPVVAKKSKYKCRLCHIILDNDDDEMRRHINQRHNFFLCGYCENETPYFMLPILKNHIRYTHNENNPKIEQIPTEMIFAHVDSAVDQTIRSENITVQEKENRERSSPNLVPSDVLSNYSVEESINELSPQVSASMTEPVQYDTVEGKLCDSSHNTCNLNGTEDTVVRASDLNCSISNSVFHRSLEKKDKGSEIDEINNAEHQLKRDNNYGVKNSAAAKTNSLTSSIIRKQQECFKGNMSRPIGSKDSCNMFKDDLNSMVCGELAETENVPFFNYEQRHDLSEGCPTPVKKYCDGLVKTTADGNSCSRVSFGQQSSQHQISSGQTSQKDTNEISDVEDMTDQTDVPYQAREPCHEIACFPFHDTDSHQPLITENSEQCLQLNQQCQSQNIVNSETLKNKLIWKLFTCRLCKISLSTISQIKGHFQGNHSDSDVHWTEKRTGLSYSDDGEKFYDKSDARRSVDTYLCGYCAFQSALREAMAKHMEYAHSSMEYHYVIPECYGDTIAYTEKCNNREEKNFVCLHEMFKTSEKSLNPTQLKYRCHICGNCSKSEFNFRLHLPEHGGFKHCSVLPHTRGLLFCAICGYLACSSNDLASHVSMHMKERRYSCSACDFDDHHRKGVYVHIRKYHGETSNAFIIDTKEQNRDINIRPTLVNLNPKVCLNRIDDDIDVHFDNS